MHICDMCAVEFRGIPKEFDTRKWGLLRGAPAETVGVKKCEISDNQGLENLENQGDITTR